jgi:MFS family permease
VSVGGGIFYGGDRGEVSDMDARAVNDVAAVSAVVDSVAPAPAALLGRTMAAVGFSVVQFWLTVPLTSLILSGAGIGSRTIGIFAMIPWLAMLLAVPLVPFLVVRLGALAVFRTGMAAACAAMIVFIVTDNVALWFAAHFLNGAGNALRWVVSDILVTGLAPPRWRGRVLGLYETLLGACLLAAPFVLTLTGSDGDPAFAIAALLPLLALAATLGLRVPRAMARSATASIPLTRLLRRHSLPLLTILLCGVVACSSYSLFPVYGRALGLSESEAALWMVLFGGGALTWQYLIGWLCDRWRRESVHRLLIAVVVAGLLLLPSLESAGPSLWLFNFVFGGAVTGLYTITLILAGANARPGEMVPLMTAITLGYTIGSIAGPAVAGWADEALPIQGLPISLAAMSLVLIAAMSIARRRHLPARR